MIFENATRLTSKEEFVEKILIYIRLVEVIAERDKIIMPQTPTTSKEVVKELQDMGVIDEEAELTDLKRVIGNEYIRFISSVAFTNIVLYENPCCQSFRHSSRSLAIHADRLL